MFDVVGPNEEIRKFVEVFFRPFNNMLTHFYLASLEDNDEDFLEAWVSKLAKTVKGC
jgi:hypothetical protein